MTIVHVFLFFVFFIKQDDKNYLAYHYSLTMDNIVIICKKYHGNISLARQSRSIWSKYCYVIIETSLKISNGSIRKSLAFKVITDTLTLYLKGIIQEDLSDKDSYDRRASYK